MNETNGTTTDTNPLGKATSIDFFNFRTPQMRAFHMSWIAFFLFFFAWFGISPLMAIVRDELALTEAQMICRLLIGFIGASFVITQYHTSKMFASNAVGTANAVTAGWGNLGGGATQAVMPLIFGMFLAMGLGDFWSWRLSMVVAGAICFLTGIAYYSLTQDTPVGDYDELREKGYENLTTQSASGSFMMAAKDYRVWILTVLYGGSFGIELTMNNFLALYFTDYFSQSIAMEGLLMMAFAEMETLLLAASMLIPFSIMVMMAEGAMYSVVPFVNRKALGSVAGLVGAGGTGGAVAAGFLFKGAFDWDFARTSFDAACLGEGITVLLFVA